MFLQILCDQVWPIFYVYLVLVQNKFNNKCKCEVDLARTMFGFFLVAIT